MDEVVDLAQRLMLRVVRCPMVCGVDSVHLVDDRRGKRYGTTHRYHRRDDAQLGEEAPNSHSVRVTRHDARAGYRPVPAPDAIECNGRYTSCALSPGDPIAIPTRDAAQRPRRVGRDWRSIP
jgi:hypothetical protein